MRPRPRSTPSPRPRAAWRTRLRRGRGLRSSGRAGPEGRANGIQADDDEIQAGRNKFQAHHNKIQAGNNKNQIHSFILINGLVLSSVEKHPLSASLPESHSATEGGSPGYSRRHPERSAVRPAPITSGIMAQTSDYHKQLSRRSSARSGRIQARTTSRRGRQRPANPRPAKPMSIIAQVAGSGTGEPISSVMVSLGSVNV